MFDAILLIGPTGSGKSPLGDYLEENGIVGDDGGGGSSSRRRSCHHFDFGENLRAAARGDLACGFGRGELDYLDDVLRKGALLENETFHIAEKILAAFCSARGVTDGGSDGGSHLLVLNGLPRHVGQAEMMAGFVRVRALLHLECSAEVVGQRLASNAGGDRTGRVDDDLELVRKKLETFHERTRPLLGWYRERGAAIVPLEIGAETRPADLVAKIKIPDEV